MSKDVQQHLENAMQAAESENDKITLGLLNSLMALLYLPGHVQMEAFDTMLQISTTYLRSVNLFRPSQN